MENGNAETFLQNSGDGVEFSSNAALISSGSVF